MPAENYNIDKKSEDFAVRIVNLYKYLTLSAATKEFVISKQLLRSGTSVGANVAESKFAQSTADFVSKYRIALKEANESEYWLRLLLRTDYITETEYKSLFKDCDELVKILVTIIKRLEQNSEK